MTDLSLVPSKLPKTPILAATLFAIAGLAVAVPSRAEPTMTCRKVVAKEATAEGRNSAKASRVKCAADEFLTGGTCYAAVRPEDDGSCQTSAMGIIQTLIDNPESTAGAFFSCLQTGGSDCPVAERTQAMAICCKITP